MAGKFRIILDENQDVVSVEVNLDGKWKQLDGKAAAGGGAQRSDEPGGCGTGSANCPARANLCLFEFFGKCYYYPC